jgi:hypothetical protein
MTANPLIVEDLDAQMHQYLFMLAFSLYTMLYKGTAEHTSSELSSTVIPAFMSAAQVIDMKPQILVQSLHDQILFLILIATHENTEDAATTGTVSFVSVAFANSIQGWLRENSNASYTRSS